MIAEASQWEVVRVRLPSPDSASMKPPVLSNEPDQKDYLVAMLLTIFALAAYARTLAAELKSYVQEGRPVYVEQKYPGLEGDFRLLPVSGNLYKLSLRK